MSRIAWNKGLTNKTDDRVKKNNAQLSISRKGKIPWNKGLKLGKNPEHSQRMKGKVPWNKGLTKEMDERVAINSLHVLEHHRANREKFSRKTKLDWESDPERRNLLSERMKVIWANSPERKQQQSVFMMKVGKLHKGENHWNWQGGISKEEYGPEFNKDLKQKVLARYEFVCALCGKSNRLQIHHVDRNKHNNHLMNLEVLCNSCHIHFHRLCDRTLDFTDMVQSMMKWYDEGVTK